MLELFLPVSDAPLSTQNIFSLDLQDLEGVLQLGPEAVLLPNRS